MRTSSPRSGGGRCMRLATADRVRASMADHATAPRARAVREPAGVPPAPVARSRAPWRFGPLQPQPGADDNRHDGAAVTVRDYASTREAAARRPRITSRDHVSPCNSGSRCNPSSENAPSELLDDTVERGSTLRTHKIENRGDRQSDARTFANGDLFPLVGEARDQVRQPRVPNRLTIDPRLRPGLPFDPFAGIVIQRAPEQERDSEGAAYVVGTRELGVMPIENAADRLLRQTMRECRASRCPAEEGAPHDRPIFFRKSLHHSIYAVSEPQ